MTDILIRTEGRAGRITLGRPKALNALTHAMCLAIEGALERWRNNADVALVLIDAEGERAFCAGGDIADIYRAGLRGDFSHARKFWADEYRMNLKLHRYPKPVVSLMQGFVMGGGVGVGCHGSQRIVGETTRMAMPECGIGLIPDVGGTYLLSRAPGRLGAYLGMSGARMGPADALLAGFADRFISETEWPSLIAALVKTGDPAEIDRFTSDAPVGPLAHHFDKIDALFASSSTPGIIARLEHDKSEFAAQALTILRRNSPLSVACTLEMLNRLGPEPTLADALRQEYRFTYRAQQEADFQEGIRAAIIDKDRSPAWRHRAVEDVRAEEVEALLAPLCEEEWTWEEPR